MTLPEMSDPALLAHEVVDIEDGKIALPFTRMHPDDLEVGTIDDIHRDSAGPIALWGEPWFKQQQASRLEVTRHRQDGAPQSLRSSDVPDGTEQTGHDIVCPF